MSIVDRTAQCGCITLTRISSSPFAPSGSFAMISIQVSDEDTCKEQCVRVTPPIGLYGSSLHHRLSVFVANPSRRGYQRTRLIEPRLRHQSHKGREHISSARTSRTREESIYLAPEPIARGKRVLSRTLVSLKPKLLAIRTRYLNKEATIIRLIESRYCSVTAVL
eukprot:7120759-Pyramimonas_sp.AAC.1